MVQYGYARSGVWQTLVDWGLVDALLPFILIFVLIFAILQKTKVFTKDDGTKPDRKINGVLAFVIAAMVVVPHITNLYPPESDPINIIMAFLPHTAVILLAVLCVIVLLGLAGGEIPSLLLWAIALGALGFLLVIILMTMIPGFFPTAGFLRDPGTQALLIILLIMGLVGYFVIRDPEESEGLGNWLKTWIGKE